MKQKKFIKRTFAVILSLILIFLICTSLYSCGIKRGLKKYNDSMQRDPKTHIIIGNEAITITPDSLQQNKKDAASPKSDIASSNSASQNSAHVSAGEKTSASPLSSKPVKSSNADSAELSTSTLSTDENSSASTKSILSSNPDSTSTACLMIHGFCGSRKNFGELGNKIARTGITVRMLKLPAHATYPEEFAALPPEDLYKHVKEEYLALKNRYDKVYVIGFSMGGSLATILASDYNVDKLVLLAPYYDITYHWYYIFHPARINSFFSLFFDYYKKLDSFTQINDKSQMENAFTYGYIPSKAVKNLVKIGKQASEKSLVDKIQSPVLFIHSRNDNASSPEASRKVFEEIKSNDKQYILLKKSNHLICIDYERDEVCERVVDFLTRVK